MSAPLPVVSVILPMSPTHVILASGARDGYAGTSVCPPFVRRPFVRRPFVPALRAPALRTRSRARSCHAWQMDSEPPQDTRLTRLWKAAESRNIPLRTILTTVGVVVAVYLLGKIVYRLGMSCSDGYLRVHRAAAEPPGVRAATTVGSTPGPGGRPLRHRLGRAGLRRAGRRFRLPADQRDLSFRRAAPGVRGQCAERHRMGSVTWCAGITSRRGCSRTRPS